MLPVFLSALCPPAPLKSLTTFWRYTNQIIIIVIMSVTGAQAWHGGQTVFNVGGGVDGRVSQLATHFTQTSRIVH